MLRRFERLLIATATAVLAAGATLLIARAQDPTPAVPSPSGQQAPACVACHTEFASEWKDGPHGQAANDPAFLKDWSSQGQPGACLVCHATNYDPATGTWQEDGVACEACHGPMTAGHPKEPDAGGSVPRLVCPLPQRHTLRLAGLAGQHALSARDELQHLP